MQLRQFVVAAGVVACTLSAHADTFVLTGMGVTDTFHLPASPIASTSSPSYGFKVTNVPTLENGQDVIEDITFFNKATGGGLLLQGADGTEVNPFGAVLYSGGIAGPVFEIGTFALQDLSGRYTLSISTATTPEPGSFLLLSTGLLAAGMSIRRRLH